MKTIHTFFYERLKDEAPDIHCPKCGNIIFCEAFLQLVFSKTKNTCLRTCCRHCNLPLVVLREAAEHIGNGRTNICKGCGESRIPLVKHHWWQKGIPIAHRTRCTARICRVCNSIPALANGTHILPKWSEQLKAINDHYAWELANGMGDGFLPSELCYYINPWGKPKWSQDATACDDFSFHISTSFEIGSGVGVSKPYSATEELLGSRMPPSRKTKGDSPQYNVVGYVEGF